MTFCPGKAANAGGVAVSGLEMSQNSERLSWTFEEVDGKLKGIMASIFAAADSAAEEYGVPGNLCGGRQHRRLQEGRRRDDGAGHLLRVAAFLQLPATLR